MENEENKIEFWDKEGHMNEAFQKHIPENPFRKNVEVIATFTNYADCEESRLSAQGFSIPVLSGVISNLMANMGYILDEKQITRIEIEKRESRTPGIAFIMQEAE